MQTNKIITEKNVGGIIMNIEKRRSERKSTNQKLKIYTSYVQFPYTVGINNISNSGASIVTNFLPREGEKVTYQLLDDYLNCISNGNAKVVRVKKPDSISESSFAIEFDKEAS